MNISSGEPQAPRAVKASSARPMTGNEAFARGAWEAGVKVGAAYPGTPSTEIMENLATYPASDLTAQWSTNEKVACDVAIGASFAGVRALTAMKHVGLNVASDALMSMTYIGANGGFVLIVCDDPGIHSSQNEQDSRYYSRLAMVPTLEPSDAQEALDYTKLAFDLSERFESPIMVRGTTRLCHTRSLVRVGERREDAPKGFVENPDRNVMMPSNARASHPRLLERERNFEEFLNDSNLIRWEPGDTKVGVISLSTPYTYVKEVIPEASVLKLGCSYPLPSQIIRDFAASVERLFVVEELEPLVENEVRAMGLTIDGKKFFPRVGELSPELVREGFVAAGVLEPEDEQPGFDVTDTPRPPVMCAGCPHISSYLSLRALDARVMGDIGCYTLAAVHPLRSIDTCVAMGSSIGNAIGLAKAGGERRPIVATIGDSTMLHSGIPALIDAVYNDVDITVILLDNQITAMTGGQNHAATGKTLRGDRVHRIDFVDLIKAIGVKWVRRVDSYDLSAMLKTFREATEYQGVAVVISDRPCVLDPVKIRGERMEVDAASCVACQACMNLGCPAIMWSDEWYDGHHKVRIDPDGCIGCSLCAQVCPTNSILAISN
ncbi:MAG: indolepyruvate ferredoxin oxidoreductase subunit alpha [Proteobacteria bacterium]|nr:indolepyruvate ferredoxin oxidoreductase subunit alpha [Pseudomonadota bacterium]